MPEPISTTTAAIFILGEFLKGTVSKAGGELYDFLKQSFSGNQAAEIALEQAKEAPEAYLPALKHHIQKFCEDDSDFRSGLSRIVTNSSAEISSQVFVSDSSQVAISTGTGNASVHSTDSESE